MAKRALERLDEELGKTFYVPFERAKARRVLTAIEAQQEQTTSIRPELDELRDALRAALEEEGESPAI
jgi:hypothetical protein